MIHLLWLSLAIPIIIHLVHRRKAKAMPFSTLRFLRMVDQRVARRQRLRELLLLALRILLLAALIGAVERPMLRSSTFKGTGVPMTVALVLDNTASMGAAKQGESAFARARTAALQVLDGLKSEDAAALVLLDAADEAPAPPTTALPELRTRISKMECGYGTAELSAPLRRALRSLELSGNPAQELYIFTDMQSRCWTDALKGVAQEIPRDVPVFVVDVGVEVSENLLVKEADFGLKANVVGTPATCTCRVENTGSQRMERKVSLFIEGRKAGEQTATVNGGAAQTAVFRTVFDRMGAFGGYVEAAPDEFSADNRRYFTVQVVDRLPVLIVDGAPSVIPYRDGAFFLKLALQGSAAPGARLSPIEAHVVADRDAASQRIEDFRCVILTDVARVEERLARRLRDYVQNGGGLLIFCGEKVDPAAYNVTLGASDSVTPSVLPAMLGSAKTAAQKADAFFLIQKADTGHPVLRDVISEKDLSATRIKSFFTTDVAKDGGGVVLMETEAGPLFLEKKLGAGDVILCTSTCTPAWNNLPLKPHFVPLVHQMIYYLSRTSGESASVPVGTPYHLTLPGAVSPVEVKFTLPAVKDAPLSEGVKLVKSLVAAGENRATLPDTARPGIYRAEFSIGGKSQQRLFAVNVPAEESAFTRLPLDRARDYLDLRNLILVSDSQRLASAVRVERQGIPLWDYLLLATIVLAVCESFVGNVFLKH